MIIEYKTKQHGWDTEIPERIILGLDEDLVIDFYNKIKIPIDEAFQTVSYDFDLTKKNIFPKYHTILADKKNLWKVGTKISSVLSDGTGKSFQFTPILLCKSVQKIKIVEDKFERMIIINGKLFHHCKKYYKNELECWNLPNDHEIHQFAHNEGFNYIDNFFDYFITGRNGKFSGKIIHWTNLKY